MKKIFKKKDKTNLKIGLILAIIALIIIGGLYKFYSPPITLTKNTYDAGFGENDMILTEMSYDMPTTTRSLEMGTGTETENRMVISTGTLSLVVKDVRENIQKIQNLAEENNGYTINSTISQYEKEISGFISIRIPSEILQKSMKEISKFGELKDESLRGNDITEEFTDIEAQLKNLKLAETKLQELFDRADNVADILEVEKELINIRSRIERLEGRMRYLSESVELSTLTVHLSTDSVALPVFEETQWKPLTILKEATRELLNFGIMIFNGLIWILVFTPVWLVLILIIWLTKKLLKK